LSKLILIVSGGKEVV